MSFMGLGRFGQFCRNCDRFWPLHFGHFFWKIIIFYKIWVWGRESWTNFKKNIFVKILIIMYLYTPPPLPRVWFQKSNYWQRYLISKFGVEKTYFLKFHFKVFFVFKLILWEMKNMVRWVHHSFRFWMSTHWEHNNSIKVPS